MEVDAATSATTTGGAQQGSGGEGAMCAERPVCALDAPGPKFTFHVHNGGTQALSLTYGCGNALPITLTTPQG